ncbi:hypothetical protein DFH27DRAFT_6940 [Peziza echinospora]|nr:hypothetical protein DFH27DRAFT_6940 [Peziza echinospora]
MSSKAKNLTYDMEEPAFLRRLRQGQGGGDQQQRYIAPRNKKRPSDDDDDAPTYVMEGGTETISIEEFNAMSAPKTEPVEDSGKEEVGAEGENIKKDEGTKESPLAEPVALTSSTEKILEVGTKPTKRKAVKMVGREADATEEEEVATDRRKRTGGKLKAKQKVKLSFDNEEQE